MSEHLLLSILWKDRTPNSHPWTLAVMNFKWKEKAMIFVSIKSIPRTFASTVFFFLIGKIAVQTFFSLSVIRKGISRSVYTWDTILIYWEMILQSNSKALAKCMDVSTNTKPPPFHYRQSDSTKARRHLTVRERRPNQSMILQTCVVQLL